jgi:hypothetical protein
MGYNSIAWLPLCAGLTVLGLVLSYFAGRRRGRLAMMRGAAWSLLPIAVYLTGSVQMFWTIGTAIGHYASGFVFSPVKWAGIAVAGVIALLFAATSGRERRRAARLSRRADRRAGPQAAGAQATAAVAGGAGAVTAGTTREMDRAGLLGGTSATATTPAASASAAAAEAKPRQRSKPPADDDMRDIDEILRKRGI